MPVPSSANAVISLQLDDQFSKEFSELLAENSRQLQEMNEMLAKPFLPALSSKSPDTSLNGFRAVGLDPFTDVSDKAGDPIRIERELQNQTSENSLESLTRRIEATLRAAEIRKQAKLDRELEKQQNQELLAQDERRLDTVQKMAQAQAGINDQTQQALEMNKSLAELSEQFKDWEVDIKITGQEVLREDAEALRQEMRDFFAEPIYQEVRFKDSRGDLSGLIDLEASTAEFRDSTPKQTSFEPTIATASKLASGSDYIPYDGYPAILHRGEAVLPAHAAELYRRGSSGGAVVVENFNVHISGEQSSPRDLARAVLRELPRARESLGIDF
ncbi:MAG: hypothetical protein G3M78_03915 [Candidatus Nitrohelix vancouverensis]|uniref:Uncharacterized protein n=1 Tax=Candidatus Nitrohelix vancouverensis TaxID=2705534 RepID=A0A7T0C122_9BACT|nr:MAG: hypothetical protein G3M78_03915 [Candidatus Nitrohelix vancouverensis]